MLTYERANELFHYDPSSGRLIWKKVTTNRVKVGDDAGTLCKTTGYTNVVVDGRGYTVHRIAILLSTGVYGKGIQVDHINHDRADNRIENLRVTSHMKNMQNQSKRITNKTGVTGVCIRYTRKGTLRYAATITVNFKPIFLGNYDTLEEAAVVRKSAEFLYGYHPNHGK